MIQRVELAGWGGEWYLRGTFDDGSPLGSAINKEARIESLPQSRAWISGAADPGRTDQALESVGTTRLNPMWLRQMSTACQGGSVKAAGPGIPARRHGCTGPGLKRCSVYRFKAGRCG
jgi:cellobiose phosphorylase